MFELILRFCLFSLKFCQLPFVIELCFILFRFFVFLSFFGLLTFLDFTFSCFRISFFLSFFFFSSYFCFWLVVATHLSTKSFLFFNFCLLLPLFLLSYQTKSLLFTVSSQFSKTSFLSDSVLVFFLLLRIPLLDVCQHLIFMNVWNIVILSELLWKEGLSDSWLSHKCNFIWFQVTFLAKFVFHELDVLCKTTLAMPVEVTISRFCFFPLFFFGASLYKQWTRNCFDVQHNELSPV